MNSLLTSTLIRNFFEKAYFLITFYALFLFVYTGLKTPCGSK